MATDDVAPVDAGAGMDMGVTAGDGVQKAGGIQKKKRKNNATASKRLRDMERMLAKHGQHLPPGKRREKEEEIVSLKALVAARTNRRKEAEITKKYRMVKFFERNKLEKRLKKDGRNPEKRAIIERDLYYVNNYPRGEKYIALFPKGGHSAESQRKVDEMRARIEGKQVEEAGDNKNNKNDAEDNEGEDTFFLPG